MREQLVQAVQTGIDKDIAMDMRRLVTLAEQCVQVVRDQPKPCVFYAAIQRIVIAFRSGQAAFKVARQRINGKEPQSNSCNVK